MGVKLFTAAGPDYNEVKDHLFDQYEFPAFDPRTGLSREALVHGFEDTLKKYEEAGLPPLARKAGLFSYVLDNAQIDVDPVDWFADHFDHANNLLYRLHERRRREEGEGAVREGARIIREASESGAFFAELDLGHISPGWRNLLEKGLPGILEEAREKLAGLKNQVNSCADSSANPCIDLRENPCATADQSLSSAIDADQVSASSPVIFYSSVITVYEAAIRFCGRLENEARRMITEHPEARDRMEKLAACLSALQNRAPETLYEALELAYLFHQLIEFEGEWVRSMGSFEWNFGRFYEADIMAGRITEEDARELIRYFWMKFFANTRGSGNGKNFYFGGLRDADNVNIGPLSYLALELFYELNQPDPKLSIKLNKRTPERFRRLIAKCLQGGRTNMVIVNDDETISAVRGRGVSVEDSYEYLLIGCYEPAIEGKEAACNMCVKFNLAKPVELALTNGRDPMNGKMVGIETGDSESFTDFEEFYSAYEKQLAFQLQNVQKAITDYERRWPVINPEPFISATFPPCMESGRDISAGGAKYNNTGSMGGGLANAADSLTAIKRIVFEEKRMTMRALRTMLERDFEGYSRELLYLKNRVPKWGNNDTDADAMAKRVTESYTSRVNGVPNGHGGIFTASMFTLDHCFTLGHRTGALPDGRARGHYLAKGIGAMTGMDKAGVTAQIESVSKLDFQTIPNGSVLDLYLHPTAVDGEKGIDTLLQLIDTYFDRGGYGVQFNILNAEDLKKAQQHPEEYRTLQVRVCGWNVYFVTLNEEQQNHFIETTMQMV